LVKERRNMGGGNDRPPTCSSTIIYLALLPVGSTGVPCCIWRKALFPSLFAVIVVASLIKYYTFYSKYYN